MSTEYRAAAREVTDAAKKTIDHYKPITEVPTGVWLSACAVACMYRAEHPDDEDELITTERLVAVGFGSNGKYELGGSEFPNLRLGLLTWCCDGGVTGGGDPPEPNYWLYFGKQAVLSGRDATMGQLRGLCLALKIELDGAA